jgi:hypothetical protein
MTTASDTIRACIVFKDGTEVATRIPPHCLDGGTFVTGRPGKVENVLVTYSHQTKRGIHVFKEVADN